MASRFCMLIIATGGRRLPSTRRISDAEAGFRLFRDFGKRRLVEHRDIGKHLAIHLYRGLLQTAHEYTVGQAAFARRGVDARNPQRAELALAIAAVAVGILPGLHHRFFGDSVNVLAAAAVTFGLGEQFLVACARRYASFDSWHGST